MQRLLGMPSLSGAFLAWYFVLVWGSGFVATKAGLAHAAPFTFLSLRYAFGLAILGCAWRWWRPANAASAWPRGRLLVHVLIAGLLMHAIHLSGSHYAQYLGLSAGITALILALQPLVTAGISARWLRESLSSLQWLGIALGLAGVALVVWHKLDTRLLSLGSLVAVSVALAAITAGTLYQRHFCPNVDLPTASFIQFALALATLAPLAWWIEGAKVNWHWQLFASIAFLVIFASILAVNALHLLMRQGEAARVTSMLYLTPLIAVFVEFAFYGVALTWLSAAGILITCVGVALAARARLPNPAPKETT